jgi:hypothetical protein
MLFYSNTMTSTTSNVAFGNAYSSVQANNINGSVHIGTCQGRLRAVELLSGSRTLSRHPKQDLRTPSVVYRTPKMHPSTRTASSTSPFASPTRALTYCARYTAGQTDKTSVVSSGSAAWQARASRPLHGQLRGDSATRSVLQPASSSRAAAATPATQTISSQASLCS